MNLMKAIFMKKSFIACLSLVILVACEAGQNTERNFLCEAQVGTPCTTMAEADGGGALTRRSIAENPNDTLAATLSQAPLAAGKPGAQSGVPAGMPSGGRPYQTSRYRIPVRLGAIWIAPHMDDAGLLHEATFVHFVISQAAWGVRDRSCFTGQ